MASFVDILQGLDDTTAYKAPCRVATTVDLGTALTGLLIIDGVQTDADDRILVRAQADETTNGIYVAQTGAWSRSIDFTGSSSILQGTQVRVSQGSSFGDDIFVCEQSNPVIGTTDITFVLQSASSSSAPSKVPFRYITSGTTDVASTNDGLIVWNSSTLAAKAQTIPAASSIPAGQSITIANGSYDALFYPITVTPVAGTIMGQPNFVININGQSVTFTSDGVLNWIPV